MLEHIPVLLNEVIQYLVPQPNQNFVDCNLGGAGQAVAILKKTEPAGKLLGIDLDSEALKIAEKNIKARVIDYKSRVILINNNFKNLKLIVNDLSFSKINGILFDLGLSSSQLQNQFRGFTFQIDGPLDMRFDSQATDLTAEKIINNWPKEKLIEIFRNFGEERLAKPIAEKIIETRQEKKIDSTLKLAGLVEKIYRRYYRTRSKIQPATKIFQALRITVNEELTNLSEVLPQVLEILEPGGRLVIISYHSLEDKIVKDFFRKESRDCLCQPEIPVCQCNHKKTLKIITKKPITPNPQELVSNPRSRSAKLRVAEKI